MQRRFGLRVLVLVPRAAARASELAALAVADGCMHRCQAIIALALQMPANMQLPCSVYMYVCTWPTRALLLLLLLLLLLANRGISRLPNAPLWRERSSHGLAQQGDRLLLSTPQGLRLVYLFMRCPTPPLVSIYTHSCTTSLTAHHGLAI
jgi:hypothetical protein